jgi:hypothetical protein
MQGKGTIAELVDDRGHCRLRSASAAPPTRRTIACINVHAAVRSRRGGSPCMPDSGRGCVHRAHDRVLLAGRGERGALQPGSLEDEAGVMRSFI